MVMQNEIIYNKIETIKNCLKRVREEYARSPNDFMSDHTLQDVVVLNLQRAVQAALDLAAHIVRQKGLKLPKESKDLFIGLYEGKIISEIVRDKMIKMVGFRNIAVHEYKKLDMNVVKSIVQSHLGDFELFVKEVLNAN